MTVLPQLIGELLQLIAGPVVVILIIGFCAWVHDCISNLDFYQYYFHYKDDLRLKDLELNRPMRVKKAFWQEWGMFYVHYASENPRESIVVKLGRRSKCLREGDIFVVLPWMKFWRCIELRKEPA